MRDLHFLNFNNYFNRTIKRLETIADYDEYLAADYVRRINFVPNDGINTEVIINCASMNIYDNMPDYVIVIDTTSNDIESRWFIIASTRTTNNQWRFTLKRDSISDNYSNVLAATCMIYRGMLRDNDVAIYNTEGTSFNKIKKWELPLKDYTGIPWIVAYISPDVAKNSKWTDEEGKEHTGPATITADIEGYYTEEYDSLEDYPYYQYIGHKYVHNQQTNILVPYQSGSNAIPTNMIHFFLMSLNRERSIAIEDMVKPDKFWDDLKIYYLSRYSELLNFPAPIISYLKDTLQERYSKLSDTILKKLNDYTDSNTTIYWSDDTATDTLVRNLQKEDGKVIKVGNKYYKVNFTFNLNQMVCDSIAIGSNIDKEIQKCLYDLPFVSYPSIDKQYTEQVYKEEMIKVFGNLYTFTISSEWDADISFTYNFSGKNVSNNETPYGILCMPYADNINVKGVGGDNTLTMPKESRVKILQALGSVGGLLYDIQLLPYCPIQGLIVGEDYVQLPNNSITEIPVISNSNTITYIYVSPTPSISFRINQSLNVEDVKEDNELSTWRLVSPNYNGQFEFNAAKFYTGDDTTINYFTVDMTCKPYTPYIHVAPEWKGLYGTNYNDARGLICSGDFSLDRISDNWETYQLNNKNFQLQFDRQIESMELNKRWQTSSALTNSIIGGIAGGVGGTIGAGMLGGPIAGTVAGIANIGAGLFQGIYNYQEQQALLNDQINAAKQQQTWQLDNIQAQPYGLTKVSTLNSNNKLFPFIEYYSCTDDERYLFEDKIKYEGMTVNRIDNISKYLINDENFISARIIRIDIKNNTAIVNDINNELSKGVYLYAN